MTWACVGVHGRLGLQVYNATRDAGFSVADGASTVVAADGLHKRDVFSKYHCGCLQNDLIHIER